MTETIGSSPCLEVILMEYCVGIPRACSCLRFVHVINPSVEDDGFARISVGGTPAVLKERLLFSSLIRAVIDLIDKSYTF